MASGIAVSARLKINPTRPSVTCAALQEDHQQGSISNVSVISHFFGNCIKFSF